MIVGEPWNGRANVASVALVPLAPVVDSAAVDAGLVPPKRERRLSAAVVEAPEPDDGLCARASAKP